MRRLFRLLTAAAPAGDHVPDAELLRRFTATRDAAAFELLVRRHADAVWSACRRILRNDPDADDAFQTAFLVLVRKADAVRGTCVGGWLHRVAVNAALKLKASGRREPAVPSLDLEQPADAGRSPESDETASVVHQEVARLPDRYRLPVVLCDLEGHTHAEAARVLNWPVGSVSGRLSRAHALLRDRLTRRGLAVPALGVALSAPVTAVSSAVAVAAGSVPPSPVVSTLAQGVLSAMRTAKLKLTAIVSAAVLGVVGVGTAFAWQRATVPIDGFAQATPPLNAAAPVPPEAPEKPIEGEWLPKMQLGRGEQALPPSAFPDLKLPDQLLGKQPERDFAKQFPHLYGENAVTIEPTDDTYRRLLKARFYQAGLYVWRFHERIAIGAFQQNEYFNYLQIQNDLRAVAIELWAAEPKTLIPRLEELVLLAKEMERYTKARVAVGNDPAYALNQSTAHRLDAEAALWKAKHPPRAK